MDPQYKRTITEQTMKKLISLAALAILLVAGTAYGQTVVDLGSFPLAAEEIPVVKWQCQEANEPDQDGNKPPCSNAEATTFFQGAGTAHLTRALRGPNGWVNKYREKQAALNKNQFIADFLAANKADQCAVLDNATWVTPAQRTGWGC